MELVQNISLHKSIKLATKPTSFDEHQPTNPPDFSDLTIIYTQNSVNPMFNASDSSGINYRIDPNFIIQELPTVTDRNCPVNDEQIHNAKLAQEEEKAAALVEQLAKELAEKNKIDIKVEVNAAHEPYWGKPEATINNVQPRGTGKCVPRCDIF